MSIRARTILAVILTNLLIILLSILAAVIFSARGTDVSIETDLKTMAAIADQLVSSEINLLKFKTLETARSIAGAGEEKWHDILAEQLGLYPDFIGAAVFDHGGWLVSQAGESPPPPDVVDDKYIRLAFDGKRIISYIETPDNKAMLFLAIPMSDVMRSEYILVTTIRGGHFSHRLSNLEIWKTGSIFIQDSGGYLIPGKCADLMQRRINLIQMAATDSQYEGVAPAAIMMTRSESGIARFTAGSVPRICAYRPVTGSEAGWSLGVIAPLRESPARNVRNGLLIVGLAALILNVIAAFFYSMFVKKPFEELALLKKTAEADSMSKSGFLANMSHEMRTPLNAVMGLSELTLGGNISGEDRENIEKVYASGEILLGIINDILDISNIESGKFELSQVEYDLPSLINDTLSLNIMNIQEKQVKFNLIVEETMPSKLYGDNLRVKQILSNVLSNAFKYTSEGQVDWKISHETMGNDVWLDFSISDTGTGIRKEDITKMFENYIQLDKNLHPKTGGTGLGLPIARRMIELMDGSITVESEYGRGSLFNIRIKQGFVTDVPIGPETVKALQDFSYIHNRHEKHSKFPRIHIPYARVLVVDDVETNLAVVRGILKPYGMRVDCVTSGPEAIHLIRNGEKYNAVFMDHMMPGMDGIEAVRIIRNEIGTEYARTVPIIALTANVIRGNEEMFLNSGFQVFMPKPIDVIKLDSVIKQWVRNKEEEDNFMKTENDSKQSKGSGLQAQDGKNKTAIEGLDLKGALDQFDGDEESLMEILKIYVDKTPGTLAQLKAFTPEKLTEYIVSVHGIKGSSRAIFAEKVSNLAEALEYAGKAGNIAFIKENNDAFIECALKQIDAIKAWLG